jgi:hypothetical protein
MFLGLSNLTQRLGKGVSTIRGFFQSGTGKALLAGGQLALGLLAERNPKVGNIVNKVS